MDLITHTLTLFIVGQKLKTSLVVVVEVFEVHVVSLVNPVQARRETFLPWCFMCIEELKSKQKNVSVYCEKIYFSRGQLTNKVLYCTWDSLLLR